MSTVKIAITLEEELLSRLDILVKSHVFPNRSKAIQGAVAEKLNKIEKNRLEVECMKLNADYEQAFAEDGASFEVEEWPEY